MGAGMALAGLFGGGGKGFVREEHGLRGKGGRKGGILEVERDPF